MEDAEPLGRETSEKAMGRESLTYRCGSGDETRVECQIEQWAAGRGESP